MCVSRPAPGGLRVQWSGSHKAETLQGRLGAETQHTEAPSWTPLSHTRASKSTQLFVNTCSPLQSLCTNQRTPGQCSAALVPDNANCTSILICWGQNRQLSPQAPDLVTSVCFLGLAYSAQGGDQAVNGGCAASARHTPGLGDGSPGHENPTQAGNQPQE